MVGLIIGSGIFRSPADVAQIMGSVGGVAVVWVLAGLVTLCLALCLAELSTLFPAAGGLYVYLREAYGPAVAFMFGWTFLLVNPASWAAIALICAEYVGVLLPLDAVERRLFATGVVALVTAANCFSLTFAALLQAVASSAKVLALAVIACVIFYAGDASQGALATPVTFAVPSIGAFGVAMVATLWAYEGAAAVCAGSGEVRDPARNLPRALILGVGTVILLYLLINVAYLYVLPLAEVAGSASVAADAVRAAAGPVGAAAVAVAAIIATFGALASTAMVDPRVFYAMACDGVFFRRVGAVHGRWQTPHVAVLTAGVLAAAYLWIGTFEQLAAQFILGMWLYYLLAVIGLLRLRRRRPDLERSYRVPGYPWIPLIFILAATGMLLNSLVELPIVSLANLGVALSALPVYYLWQHLRRRG